MYEILSPDLRNRNVKRSNMKQRLLWQADINELVEELLKRRSDNGTPHFSLDINRAGGLLRIKLEALSVRGDIKFEIDEDNGQ